MFVYKLSGCGFESRCNSSMVFILRYIHSSIYKIQYYIKLNQVIYTPFSLITGSEVRKKNKINNNKKKRVKWPKTFFWKKWFFGGVLRPQALLNLFIFTYGEDNNYRTISFGGIKPNLPKMIRNYQKSCFSGAPTSTKIIKWSFSLSMFYFLLSSRSVSIFSSFTCFLGS